MNPEKLSAGDYQFEGPVECPVCEEALEAAGDVYRHLQLHEFDIETLVDDKSNHAKSDH